MVDIRKDVRKPVEQKAVIEALEKYVTELWLRRTGEGGPKEIEPFRLTYEELRDRYRAQEDTAARQAMHELAVSNNRLARIQAIVAGVVAAAVIVQTLIAFLSFGGSNG